MGWTLIRTVVQGQFHMGIMWNPAGAAPHADALEGIAFDFAVRVQLNDDTVRVPTPLSDSDTDSNIVWRGSFKQVGSSYNSAWGADGSMYVGHWISPEGKASESFARRANGPDAFGLVYFQWLIQSRYIAALSDITAGYNNGGIVFDYMLAGRVSVDQLWEEAAA